MTLNQILKDEVKGEGEGRGDSGPLATGNLATERTVIKTGLKVLVLRKGE